MLDIMIKNGLIVDGTGSPGFYGHVGIDGDSVQIFRGDISSISAIETIEADDRVVCPGFIDVHAHSGLVILSQPEHHAKVRQGVTTELIGVDGNSYAPFRNHDDFLRFVELNSGLDGNPPLPGKWSTVEQYLNMFHRKVAVNIAYILGNSPVRIDAIGWHSGVASASDIENMKSMIREAMEEGAFGLSTGLDYPPGNFANTDEIVALCQQVSDLGGIYHTHVRYRLGGGYLDPHNEAIEIGKRSGVPVHITHLSQRASYPSGDRLLQLVETASETGQDITFDSVPLYPGSTRILILFPDWVHDGGPEKIKEVLSSSEGRERLKKEIVVTDPSWQDMWVTYFKNRHNYKFDGMSVSEVALARNQHPVDAICDLLLEEDLQVSYNAMGSNLKTLPAFITHPLSMVGSDALLLGDHPPPRSYGTFTSILESYTRDEQQMSLPTAIRKMTAFPAQRLGIRNRGILRDGMKADIVVFDPLTVKTTATRTNPKQFPIGIQHVFVNGIQVVKDSVHTGALPGRALKFNRGSI